MVVEEKGKFYNFEKDGYCCFFDGGSSENQDTVVPGIVPYNEDFSFVDYLSY